MKKQGESSGVGSKYDATFDERPNTSNTRNQGPEGSKSNVGNVKKTTKQSRKTNQVG